MHTDYKARMDFHKYGCVIRMGADFDQCLRVAERVGFELGLLKVVQDEAYKKATGRSRNRVVLTTVEERHNMHRLK